MRAFIGNKLIPTIKPKTKQYDIRDNRLAGFMIRVNPSGKMRYVCQYTRGRRITLGAVGMLTPAQARDKALAILSDAANGIYPTEQKKATDKITIKTFIEDYYEPWFLAHRKSGKKTIDHIDRCFTKPFGDMPLNELTPSFIDSWRTKRLKDSKSTETVNRDIATFKAAISKAVLWGLIESHPLDKLKLLKSDKSGKVRYLNADEESKLRNTLIERDDKIKNDRERANDWRKERGYTLHPDLSKNTYGDHLHPMIILSLNTGIRRGEIYSLKWENVNFDRSTLTIEGAYAKSGNTRHIPLNSEALSVLKAWRKQTNTIDLVFPNKDGEKFNTVKKGWEAILEKSGIKEFRWHDMRHHFASKLVMAGVDLNTVRELLGHSDMKMTLRYAHLAPEHKAAAVEKLIQ